MIQPYEKEHVTFDAFEIPVSLHCIRCNAVIATRSEIPSKRFPGTAMMGTVRAPNYREVQVDFNDGSTGFLPVCSECVKEPLDKEKAMDVVKRTWEKEMRHMGRPESAILQMREARANLAILDKGDKDAR